MALKFKWHKELIEDETDAKQVFKILRTQSPKYFGFDTETTGLNIRKDKPFLFQFGWLNTETNENNTIDEMRAYSFAVDIEQTPELAQRVIRSWHNYLKGRASDDIWYMALNIKFDMHMCANIGLPVPEEIPITEAQFWIRYAHDALQSGEGGPSLKLKEYAAKFIDRDAKFHDNTLQKERSAIAAAFNNRLKMMLSKAKCEVPEQLKTKYKSITLSCLKELFKDPIFDLEMLPEDIRKVYIQWKSRLPDWIRKRVLDLVDPDTIPYNKLNRTILVRYGLEDIVWLLEIFWQCKPVAERRNNTKALYEIENPCLWPVWRMERVGYKIDIEYLERSRIKLRDYILRQRKALFDLTGANFKIGQHAFIKNMLNNDFNLEIESTAASEIDLLLSKLERDGTNPEAVQCIKLIQELRTLEKWYSVYIMRFKVDLNFYETDRIWTQFNTVGAVSGRFVSDMQQMPKDGILDFNREELFNPRKMVIIPKDEGFAGMAIVD